MQILLFHGVVDKQDIYESYKWKHIEKDTFKKVVEIYKNKKNSTIFSFDDAYKNCFESCKYLIKNNFSVSIAVPTSRVGTNYFWNDEIEFYFLNNPRHFIFLNNTKFNLSNVQNKISSLENFKSIIRSLDLDKQEKLINKIKEDKIFWENKIMPQKSNIMNYKELNTLKNLGVNLVHHSHSHKSLSSMSFKELNKDVESCVNDLKRFTNTTPNIFVVPFGNPSDWSLELEEILIKHEFKEIWMVNEPFKNWANSSNKKLKRRIRTNVDKIFVQKIENLPK